MYIIQHYAGKLFCLVRWERVVWHWITWHEKGELSNMMHKLSDSWQESYPTWCKSVTTGELPDLMERSYLTQDRRVTLDIRALFDAWQEDRGVGIAQWLERRTRDWKVMGSNPCWNGGRIFFSRVDFLCWLLFRYPFHPCVTTVARKKSRSFCQKCRCQVTAKHAYTLRMWILLNRASALVTTCP